MPARNVRQLGPFIRRPAPNAVAVILGRDWVIASNSCMGVLPIAASMPGRASRKVSNGSVDCCYPRTRSGVLATPAIPAEQPRGL